ncbi:hypothetical protein [Tardiphaga sp.]|uniref:hypothetical protein n=1 Tax=Tardiphaga sp. TaxID=1926292 RepID=UPI00352BA09C
MAKVKGEWMVIRVAHRGVHDPDEASPASRLQSPPMFEKDIGIGRTLSIGARRDMSEVGEKRRSAIDLLEDRVGERRHPRDVRSVSVCLDIAISRVNIGVRVDRTDSAIKRPLDEAASDSIVGVALP